MKGKNFSFLQILVCVIYFCKAIHHSHSLICRCTSTVTSLLIESSLHIANNGVCASNSFIDYNLAMAILEKELRHFAPTLTWNSAEILIQDHCVHLTSLCTFGWRVPRNRTLLQACISVLRLTIFNYTKETLQIWEKMQPLWNSCAFPVLPVASMPLNREH